MSNSKRGGYKMDNVVIEHIFKDGLFLINVADLIKRMKDDVANSFKSRLNLQNEATMKYLERLHLNDEDGDDPEVFLTSIYPPMVFGYLCNYPVIHCNHGEWTETCVTAKTEMIRVIAELSHVKDSDEGVHLPRQLLSFTYPEAFATHAEPFVNSWKLALQSKWDSAVDQRKANLWGDMSISVSKVTTAPKEHKYVKDDGKKDRVEPYRHLKPSESRNDLEEYPSVFSINSTMVDGHGVDTIIHSLINIPDNILLNIITVLWRGCINLVSWRRWCLGLTLVSKKIHRFIASRLNDSIQLHKEEDLVKLLTDHFQPSSHPTSMIQRQLSSFIMQKHVHSMLLKPHKSAITELLGPQTNTIIATAQLIEYATRFTRLDSLSKLKMYINTELDLDNITKIATRLEVANAHLDKLEVHISGGGYAITESIVDALLEFIFKSSAFNNIHSLKLRFERGVDHQVLAFMSKLIDALRNRPSIRSFGIHHQGCDSWEFEGFWKEPRDVVLQNLLDYLKSTTTLETLKINYTLNEELLTFLLQSRDCSVTRLKAGLGSCNIPITRELESIHICSKSAKSIPTDEFLSSLNRVDRIKIQGWIPRVVALNNQSTSLTVDTSALIKKEQLDEALQELQSNNTLKGYGILEERPIHGHVMVNLNRLSVVQYM
ncbi:hypothetical protein SAMD00019534_104760 [Acytostelium subglobosum LB1]|uniref:hypothetical protein n=1 Tax=Acytostelium subglobosum LB1 TaxID=1410327 RepID=UPI000644F0FE|nr:hypothetical protein SAMD00019534_104760 [Acytostelium subglobosum LB1]GAM27301.1 hypothetical protein SAMD00019534_104760 [Acytostelium subglobosum LB1]|eukprot:XP_012749768.1 hypothetical protein SAMD00019534_104760 [Acytostelium subglobosum LB1]